MFCIYLFIYILSVSPNETINSTKEGTLLFFFSALTPALKLESDTQCMFNKLSNKNNTEILQESYKHERKNKTQFHFLVHNCISLNLYTGQHSIWA